MSPAHGRGSYLFNSTIAGIEDADAILIVGANPRIEASLVNVRIRKRWRMAPPPIALIGERVDLTYPYDYLGAGPETLADVAAGRHSFLEKLQGCAEAADHRRAGRICRAGRACGSVARRPARREHRRGQGGLERLLGPAHMRPRASARSISASCRARAA